MSDVIGSSRLCSQVATSTLSLAEVSGTPIDQAVGGQPHGDDLMGGQSCRQAAYQQRLDHKVSLLAARFLKITGQLDGRLPAPPPCLYDAWHAWRVVAVCVGFLGLSDRGCS